MNLRVGEKFTLSIRAVNDSLVWIPRLILPFRCSVFRRKRRGRQCTFFSLF